MSGIDIIGHLGYFLLFSGVVLVGRKWPVGWLLYVTGDLVWLALGWKLGLTSIVLWQVAFLAMALWNWRSWRQEGKLNPWTSWTSLPASSGSSSTRASAASGT